MSEITSLDRMVDAILEKSHFGVTPETAKHCATAALLAIRDPSEYQYEALAQVGVWRELNSQRVWQTYIDAILNEASR